MTAGGGYHRTPVEFIGVGAAAGGFGRRDEGVRLREEGPSGALLVRPDTIVARRGAELPAGPPAAALGRPAGAAAASPPAGS
ncbi:MAG TPA: hypothetical protein VFN19_09255 [Candidatus Nanopelagicales bacterium]|nr:hypothetical protein [Candidatus Nanopelagicales bacterium]